MAGWNPHKSNQLQRRIARDYVTITDRMKLGPLELPFTRVADPDTVLDDVAAKVDLAERLSGKRVGDVQHLPYWAELWDSAIGLGTWLATEPVAKTAYANRQLVGGRLPQFVPPPKYNHPGTRPNVLDLGCGMGLAGTVAAALGANVLFADLEQPALLFALLNSHRYADRVRTRQLNWQTDDLGERFELILGADILYERKQWDYLEPFWRKHLTPGGKVLVGEPGRQTGDQFPAWIQDRGWELRIEEQPVVTRPRPIRLFMLTPLPSP